MSEITHEQINRILGGKKRGPKKGSKKRSKKSSKKGSKKGSKNATNVKRISKGITRSSKKSSKRVSKKSSKRTSKRSSKRVSKKSSKRSSKKGSKQSGGRGASDYIKKQTELSAYISKNANLKQGRPMMKLISWLRKKAAPNADAVESLAKAKEYFNSHKDEAKKEYEKFANEKIVRKSKKSNKK
jgi:hypothetical protein